MAFHVEKSLDLAHGKVLAVAKCHQLVKGTEELVGITNNLALVKRLARTGDNLGKEMQRINVLQDVGLAVGDEHHVELVKGLVDESDVVLLDRRVLGAAVCQLGERCKESLDPGPRHLAKLPREDSFTAAGADRSRENDLGARGTVSQSARRCMSRYSAASQERVGVGDWAHHLGCASRAIGLAVAVDVVGEQ